MTKNFTNEKKIMRLTLVTKTLSFMVAVGAFVLTAPRGAAQNAVDEMEVVRSALKADRKVVIAEGLQLTETESRDFWPIYREYRAEMDKIADGMVKLVLEYSDVYPDVPEHRARQMINEVTRLEKKLADRRSWYMKRVGRVLTASKTLRFLQLENRLDLAVRLQVARGIPLVPARVKTK